MTLTKETNTDPSKISLSERLKRLRSSNEVEKTKRTSVAQTRERNLSKDNTRGFMNFQDRVMKEKTGMEMLNRVGQDHEEQKRAPLHFDKLWWGVQRTSVLQKLAS